MPQLLQLPSSVCISTIASFGYVFIVFSFFIFVRTYMQSLLGGSCVYIVLFVLKVVRIRAIWLVIVLSVMKSSLSNLNPISTFRGVLDGSEAPPVNFFFLLYIIFLAFSTNFLESAYWISYHDFVGLWWFSVDKLNIKQSSRERWISQPFSKRLWIYW